MTANVEREFADRVVLVTGGGGSCIGGPTALRFAQEGAHVVVCDQHERRLREWAERIRKETSARVLDFHLDIADRPKVDRMIEETERSLGPVDLLICNAAENKLGHMVDYDPADWDRTIDVSLSANFYLARKVLPSMVERRRGGILNIGSIAAWVGDPNPDRGEPAYAAAKAALLSLTRNVAYEVGPAGVRCNAIALGLIWSRFVEKFDAQFRPLVEKTPLRRYGTTDDVIECILFLASDRRSGFITGEAINVSGGFYMRP
jgi:NAD(P)-dependent dehydrogenase (short-subunit alcohol dehydrogenase family)